MEKNTLFFAYHYKPFICISIMLFFSFWRQILHPKSDFTVVSR